MLIDPSRALFENRSVATCAAMDNVRWPYRGSCVAAPNGPEPWCFSRLLHSATSRPWRRPR